MSEKTIVRLERADRDLNDAIEYYMKNGGPKAALGFVGSLEKGLGHISRFPATGSVRHGHQLKVPGLRCWPIERYPYLIFFIEHEQHVDILRVLHASRDIDTTMQLPFEN